MCRLRLALRRVLIGAALGAAIGLPLSYLVAPNEIDRAPRLVLMFVGIMAALGAVAAGFLSRTGWAMLGGAAVGALVAGICGVIATMHPKGLIYSILGVPFGAVLVMLCCLEDEPPNRAHRSPSRSPSPAQSGVWDRELDG